MSTCFHVNMQRQCFCNANFIRRYRFCKASFVAQANVQLQEGDVISHFRRKQVLQEVIVLLSAVLEALDRQERMAESLSSGSPDFELANKVPSLAQPFVFFNCVQKNPR